MKRSKHHKIKREQPESSTSYTRGHEEHDLAYYIHDRVELMHQVFSVLKYKELKAMAPACIRNISIDDLQELCTEELLGISSKRLCAILDGADPPSDTESSSQSPTEPLETISLDSISSDEEILSQEDKKKKKHKHRRRDSKSKRKKSKEDKEDEQQTDKSKASRAGLTVLELLELQARARAIRAQLQQEQSKAVPQTAVESAHSHTSEDEVEIKEEPAEVVEISSDEEKPKIEDLEINNTVQKITESQPKTVTKHVNDLIITVPQQKTQKIKLNRTKNIPQDNNIKATAVKEATEKINKVETPKEKEVIEKTVKAKGKTKKKKKKRLSNASDNDEITLQLSDSEKMDLLEDFDRKNYDNVSSETSSDSDGEEMAEKSKNIRERKTSPDVDKGGKDVAMEIVADAAIDTGTKEITREELVEIPKESTEGEKDKSVEIKNNDISEKVDLIEVDSVNENTEKQSEEKDKLIKDKDKTDDQPKDLSEGELSDRASSEVEAMDLKPEVVCISDEDDSKNKKKKKKKDKKSKKDKKGKKKDFREKADEKFDKITEVKEKDTDTSSVSEIKEDIKEMEPKHTKTDITVDDTEDKDLLEDNTDIVEISDEVYELSDDSSNDYDTVNVLSKEPTASEIEALSAKIDEIQRVEVITEEEIREYESKNEEIQSWKERYLDSQKVRKVLNTSNILNALRKKNIELKRRLEESKIEIETTEVEEVKDKDIAEGSIDQYNTLEGSTKFVDPVKETPINDTLKKDAKQLLRMYKKLLKYNDMERKKDPNKKKKKKSKKEKTEDKVAT